MDDRRQTGDENNFSKNVGIYGARWAPLNESRGILRIRQGIYEGIYGAGKGHLWALKVIYGERQDGRAAWRMTSRLAGVHGRETSRLTWGIGSPGE